MNEVEDKISAPQFIKIKNARESTALEESQRRNIRRTCFTVCIYISRYTCTRVLVDEIVASCTILARRAVTFIDV